MKAQRMRVTFARDEEAKYITHLDLMRSWERALRRAEIPVAYSEGFSPHPQIAMAAPLPVGVTSEVELMDVFLEQVMAPASFCDRVAAQLPDGLRVVRADEAGLTLPSLQGEVRAVEYEVDFVREAGLAEEARRRADEFLAAETWQWEQRREDETRTYDLRALVHDVAVAENEGALRLRMLLRADSSGSGRPEQVAAALGLPQPLRIHRTRLLLARTSAAREAWRRRGRFIE